MYTRQSKYTIYDKTRCNKTRHNVTNLRNFDTGSSLKLLKLYRTVTTYREIRKYDEYNNI